MLNSFDVIEATSFRKFTVVEFECDECGKRTKKHWHTIKKSRFAKLCPSCLQAKTNMTKYGVTASSQSIEVKERARATCIERYGGPSPTSSDEIREKQRDTVEQRFGERSILSVRIVREKTKRTKERRYGTSTYNNRDKYRATCFERYGVPHSSTPERIEKWKQTCIERFGGHPLTNQSIRSKLRAKYYYEGCRFDSSWELAFWVYHVDNDIPIMRNYERFEYIGDDKRKHYCIPDFTTRGGLVEIKGDHLKKWKNWVGKSLCYQKHNIRILSKKDIDFYLSYIDLKYGKGFLRSFRVG